MSVKRMLMWAGGLVFGAVSLLVLSERVASEWYEVVVLVSKDAAGDEHETRLWVVDWRGTPYLRGGSQDSQWYARVRANPEIDVTRNGERRTYCSVLESGVRTAVSEAFAAKYKWANSYIGWLVGGREPLAPVALRRCAGR